MARVAISSRTVPRRVFTGLMLLRRMFFCECGKHVDGEDFCLSYISACQRAGMLYRTGRAVRLPVCVCSDGVGIK